MRNCKAPRRSGRRVARCVRLRSSAMAARRTTLAVPEANCRRRRHAHVRHCLQRIRRATPVRRRELEADDAKDLTCATCISKPTLVASALQMRNADAQCLPADRVGSAVPDNATAASAQATDALTLDRRRSGPPSRVNWPRSAGDRTRGRQCAGQSPTHLHGRVHSRVAATACARH